MQQVVRQNLIESKFDNEPVSYDQALVTYHFLQNQNIDETQPRNADTRQNYTQTKFAKTIDNLGVNVNSPSKPVEGSVSPDRRATQFDITAGEFFKKNPNARVRVKPEEFSSIQAFFDAGNYHPEEKAPELDEKALEKAMLMQEEKNAGKCPNERFFKPGAYTQHRKMFPDYDKPLVNKRKSPPASPFDLSDFEFRIWLEPLAAGLEPQPRRPQAQGQGNRDPRPLQNFHREEPSTAGGPGRGSAGFLQRADPGGWR